ncbi:hypothetical protein PIB30_110860 [Stylosanthes scabra]|uniref:Uncharacterized protein n=1 Tax=Stylosanthes scabra TaxID=79078 RepID=A0ABU6ZYV2_9FABA|nr:hypothetical protein [Stylosanthes scabra]
MEKREAEGLAKSLGDRQVALESAEAATAHWQGEWKSLAEETGEMVQETFDILMDQAEAQEQAGPEAEKRPDPEVGVQAAEDIQEVLPEA